MKKFLVNILLFIVVSLVCAMGLDYIITKGLHKHSDYLSEVWCDLMDTTQNYEVIILGSSEAIYDYCPLVIDSVLHTNSYAFGRGNLTFPAHLFTWNMYKKYHANKLPKLVILSLDYVDMCYRPVKTSLENEQFLPLFYEPLARDFLKQYGEYNLADMYIPCWRYYGHQQRIYFGISSFLGLGKTQPKWHYKGYAYLTEPDGDNEPYTQQHTIDFQLEICQLMDTFLMDCKQHGVDVIVLASPTRKDLSSVVTNWNEIYDKYQQIAQQNAVPYMDYTHLYDDEEPSHFASPNHLLGWASISYSDTICQLIKQLKLLE